MKWGHTFSVLALTVALLMPTAAFGQLLEFDRPMAIASDEFNPGVTFGSSWINLFGHASHVVDQNATDMQMGSEFMTPKLWRFQPYARVAFTPGTKFHLKNRWGGVRAYQAPFYDLTSRNNLNDWRMVIALFGNVRE